MQNFILRVDTPYSDSDEEKKRQLSVPLRYVSNGGWYPHNLLFAALLAILFGWILYMLRGVFGLHLLDFHADNLADGGLILLAFVFFWSLLSGAGFVLRVLKRRRGIDKVGVSLSGEPTDIVIKFGMFYSLVAILLYGVLLVLDRIKNHPWQRVALAMLVLLFFVSVWLHFHARMLALSERGLQHITQPRRARRAKTIGTSFATLTKYYPSKRHKGM